MSATTAASRVQRGAKLLDRRQPGWAEQIDLDQLDLANPCKCVLGQLYHDSHVADPYGAGLDDLELYDPTEIDYGFAIDDGDAREAWAELDRLWAEQIRARQGRATPGGASGGGR